MGERAVDYPARDTGKWRTAYKHNNEYSDLTDY
jgi:hypothetical protein